MGDRFGQLESELRSTRELLTRLEERVVHLEQFLPGAEVASSAEAPEGLGEPAVAMFEASDDLEVATATEAASFEEPAVRIGAGLVGGILLVLAGGYLMRALTESGALPAAIGIAVGLVYAFSWSVVGHVAAARRRFGVASANGIATALVALPIVWEATVRFQVLSPWMASGLLVLTGAVLLPLAERHRLATVAWIAVLGIGAASIALVFGTREAEPFAVTLLLLGLTAALVGGRHGALLPWAAYGFADLGALLLFLGSLGEIRLTSPGPTVSILVAFFVGFLAIFVYQSWRSGEIGLDAPLQGTVATFLGFGGALWIVRADLPAVAPWLAGAGLLLGVAGHLFLLAVPDWTRENRWPFLLYSNLALAVAAMSVGALFPRPAWLFAVFAVILAVIGVWRDRVSPALHAALLVLLAAIVGGLSTAIRSALIASADTPWPPLEPAALAALGAAIVCMLLPLKVASPVWSEWLPRLGRATVILVVALGLDALIVRAAAPWMANAAEGLDAGILAALRTGVVAFSIVLLAVSGRWRRLQPATWLVWPLLAGLGLKLVIEDFPQGRPMTLAAALLLYGGALILAPRLMRPDRTESIESESQSQSESE